MKKTLETILDPKNINYINECFIWKRCLNTDGYPRANINSNMNSKVHRIIYELSNPTEDIKTKVIRHTCDNPKCINPNHLISGTHTDNMKDRDFRERHGKAKVTHNEVKEIRNLAATNNFLQKEIASMFKLNHRTISSIINRTHFKHVL